MFEQSSLQQQNTSGFQPEQNRLKSPFDSSSLQPIITSGSLENSSVESPPASSGGVWRNSDGAIAGEQSADLPNWNSQPVQSIDPARNLANTGGAWTNSDGAIAGEQSAGLGNWLKKARDKVRNAINRARGTDRGDSPDRNRTPEGTSNALQPRQPVDRPVFGPPAHPRQASGRPIFGPPAQPRQPNPTQFSQVSDRPAQGPPARPGQPVLPNLPQRRSFSLNTAVFGRRDQAWHTAVNGKLNQCPGYEGGGYINGPDGRTYPVVIPTIREGNRRYTAEGSGPLPPPNQRVSTLGGRDPGWRPAAPSIEGTEVLGRPISGWERAMMATPSDRSIAYVPERGYAHLRTPPDRKPWLSEQPSAFNSDGPQDKGLGTEQLNTLRLVRQQDGTLTTISQSPQDSLSRPQARLNGSPVSPSRNQRGNAAMAAGDFAVMQMQGASNAANIEEFKRYHYNVSFQENQDGRRRAIIDAYHLSPGANNQVVISPAHIYMNPQGDMIAQSTTYRNHVRHEISGPRQEISEPRYGIVSEAPPDQPPREKNLSIGLFGN